VKKIIAVAACFAVLFSVHVFVQALPAFNFDSETAIYEEEKAADLIPEPRKMVAITFDDGPTDITIQILNDLAKYNARATFFVLGNRLERFPETTQRIVNEGHQIGNHSFSHKRLNRISVQTMKNELDLANEAIFKATGVKPTIMRAPYGEHDKNVLEAAAARGMAVIKWNIDSIDWQPGTAVGNITQRALKNVQAGDIILLHDLYPETGVASAIIIKELTDRGFELVTVDELIEYYSTEMEPGAVYISGVKKFSVADGVDFDEWYESNR